MNPVDNGNGGRLDSSHIMGCYSWLKYLPGQEYHSSPFEAVSGSIYGGICAEDILESLEGKLEAPGNLRLIPEKFRDKDGKVLVPAGRDVSTLL